MNEMLLTTDSFYTLDEYVKVHKSNQYQFLAKAYSQACYCIILLIVDCAVMY
jgi:hypothetical protein